MGKALDDELDAYTKSSEDYIESLRESIKETDLLIEQTYQKVIQGSNTVLETIYTLSETYKFPIDQNLTNPWENATQKSLDFETYAKGHIYNIYDYVESMKGDLAESLGAPYKSRSVDAEGNPLYEFSGYAAEQIDKVIADNVSEQQRMKSSLDGGFEQAKSSIQGWSTAASGAVENVINKFTDPQNGLLAKLNETTEAANKAKNAINSMPNHDGGYTAPTSTNTGTSGTDKPGGYVLKPTNTYITGQSVKNLQKVLNGWLGTNLTVDGSYGPATEEAVKKAQKAINNSQLSGVSKIPNINGKYNGITMRAMHQYFQESIKKMKAAGSSSAIGQGIQQYTQWKNLLPTMAMYAKGTLGTKKDELALTDESWIGEEITLGAGKSGHLQYLKKGSAVMPADISENLVEWGKRNPKELGATDGVDIINNYVNAPTNAVNVENSLAINGKNNGDAKDIHSSIKDTYELIEETIADIYNLSRSHKQPLDENLTSPWISEANKSLDAMRNSTYALDMIYNLSEAHKLPLDTNLTAPWISATQKTNEFNIAANTHYGKIINHIDEQKGMLETALNTPYEHVTNDIYSFSKYAKKTSIDDVITHANLKSGTLTTSLSTSFNNAKSATDAFKTSGTGAVSAVEDSFTNKETGLIPALEKSATKAKELKEQLEKLPKYTGMEGIGGAIAPASGGAVSSPYGMRTHPISGKRKMHTGVDFPAGEGTPINAYGAGEVISAGWNGGYGNCVIIDHGDGNHTLYAHASKLHVKRGDYVTQGQRIANIGSTGNSTGPHLHFEYRKNGAHTNPRELTQFSKGTFGTKKDQLAITDESWIGEEITLAAGKNGQLQYLKKGSAVMPADISANLVEWGKLNPNMIGVGSMTDGINLMSNYINKPEIKVDVENFLKVGTVSRDTLPELEKLMDKKIDTFAKQLNASIRKFK